MDDHRMQGYLKKKHLRSGLWLAFWVEHDILHDDMNYYTENPSLGPQVSRLRGHFSLDGAGFDAKLSKTGNAKLIIQRRNGSPVIWRASNMEEAEAWVRHLKSTRAIPKSLPQLLTEWKKGKDLIKCIARNEEELDSLVKKEYGTVVDFDDDDFDPTLDLPKLTLKDLDGKTTTLGNVADKRITVIVLLRNYGCVTTKVAAANFLSKVEDFESIGVQLIAVAAGSTENASKWKKETSFPGLVFCDSDNVLAKTFSCKRGYKYIISPRSLSAVQKALSEGFKPGVQEGDQTYLGGTFVYGRREGIIFQHLEGNLGDQVDVEEILESILKFQRDHPDRTWGTPSNRDYGVFNTVAIVEAGGMSKPYHYEKGNALVISEELPRLLDFAFYTRSLQPRDHSIWLRKLPDNYNVDDTDDPIGPATIVVAKEMNGDYTTLIFSKNGVKRRLVGCWRDFGEKETVKFLATTELTPSTSSLVSSKDTPVIKMRKCSNINMVKTELLKWESLERCAGYKFGVLLAKAGETTEEHMYIGSTTTTEQFETFIDCLGSRVELVGRTGYMGGLDNKTSRTGTHSIFTNFDDANVMFHVSTLIPATPQERIIAQKRHIGNDMGVIIFKEGPEEVDIGSFRTQYNHFFIVVREANPGHQGDPPKYTIEVISKFPVPPSPPFLPEPSFFEIGPYMRQWILAKLLNMERMTSDCVPIFRGKRQKVRAQALVDMVNVSQGKKVSTPSEIVTPVPEPASANKIPARRGSLIGRKPSDMKSPNNITLDVSNIPSSDRLALTASADASPKHRNVDAKIALFTSAPTTPISSPVHTPNSFKISGDAPNKPAPTIFTKPHSPSAAPAPSVRPQRAVPKPSGAGPGGVNRSQSVGLFSHASLLPPSAAGKPASIAISKGNNPENAIINGSASPREAESPSATSPEPKQRPLPTPPAPIVADDEDEVVTSPRVESSSSLSWRRSSDFVRTSDSVGNRKSANLNDTKIAHKAQFDTVKAKWNALSEPEPSLPVPRRLSRRSLSSSSFGRSSINSPNSSK